MVFPFSSVFTASHVMVTSPGVAVSTIFTFSGAAGLSATSFTLQAVPAGEQDFVQYAVFAITEGGENGVYTPMIAAGTPYDGLEESFPDAGLSYAWGTGFSNKEGAWSIYDDAKLSDLASQDGDNGYAVMDGQYLDSSSALFTTKSCSPAGTA